MRIALLLTVCCYVSGCCCCCCLNSTNAPETTATQPISPPAVKIADPSRSAESTSDLRYTVEAMLQVAPQSSGTFSSSAIEAMVIFDTFSMRIFHELIKGDSGIFDVEVDGRRIFSKGQVGRFPEDAEVLEQLGSG